MEFFGFFERLNQWVGDDNPCDDFRFWAMAWFFRLQEDPYVDAEPAEAIGVPWWFAKIPNAEDDNYAVVCLYSVENGKVRCGGITTLRKPMG